MRIDNEKNLIDNLIGFYTIIIIINVGVVKKIIIKISNMQSKSLSFHIIIITIITSTSFLLFINDLVKRIITIIFKNSKLNQHDVFFSL